MISSSSVKENFIHSELTGKILIAFFKVYNTLGYGFLEKVYENAMMIELQKMDLFCEQQKKLIVHYEGHEVGEYYPDILVECTVTVELKAAESINPDHEAQLVNYLKATDLEIGLVLNFGKKPQFVRRVLTNTYKKRS